LKENGLLIGRGGLLIRKELDDVDLGFAMVAEHEGRGYGFESSMAILDLAKNKFKLNRILAITLPVNKNSIKLIEKLGMVFEQAVRPFEDDEELLLFAIDL
jgi:RimJ/RimL family protein N-acetyltransferase